MTDTEKSAEHSTEHPEDTSSDPAETDATEATEGGDWSDEGGATPTGPATDTEA